MPESGYGDLRISGISGFSRSRRRSGFTTQNASRGEVSTSASSLPRKLIGRNTVDHTRRPESWARLSQTEAALLDFLRHGGKTSELSPAETLQRTLRLLKEPGRYDRPVESGGYRASTCVRTARSAW